jgi:hypothetical protein
MSFWVSAFTERRVLVESWGYAARTNATAADGWSWPTAMPFWDPQRLAANDAAFTAPTPELLDWLRARGVRWMVVDRRFGPESARLRALASLRWERGPVAVYAVPNG